MKLTVELEVEVFFDFFPNPTGRFIESGRPVYEPELRDFRVIYNGSDITLLLRRDDYEDLHATAFEEACAAYDIYVGGAN